MITTTYKLECTHCGKTAEYIDIYPHNQSKPKNWYSLQPNTEHSQWLTTDFSTGGDFCCLECVLAYVQEAIENRDNPIVGGDFSTSKMIRLNDITPTDGE